MANSTTRTPEKEHALLDALRDLGKVSSACRKARVPKRTYYGWREADAGFRISSDAARHEGLDALCDDLEDALVTRGKKNDTTAAIFMLKSHRPDTYREKTEHSVRVSGTIHHRGLSALSEAELDQLELLAAKIEAGEVVG